MIGPPGVERKYVRRGKKKRRLASVFINRTVLVTAFRFATVLVRLVRFLVSGE
jgi:hypothetical protein